MCLLFSSILFSPNDIPSKTEKCFVFHLGSSFSSQEIHFFVFLSFPFFLPVSHCFRGRSKINLKVHDVINFLNKNSISHFVWYPEKEKRYDIEILSIDGVSDKEHFIKKSLIKCAAKGSPRTFLILVNNPKQLLHARNYLKSKIFWKRIIKKR